MPRSIEKVWQYKMPLFLIFAIFFILGSIACTRTQRFHAYDGTWWMNTPLNQRLGFIDGFVDCYTYGKQSTKPRNWYQAAISSYYEKHSGDESMLVGQVLIRIAESTKDFSLPGRNSANVVKLNGTFDGRVWLIYSQKERMGFIEGCLNALMPRTSRSVIFPKSPEYYTDVVTRFYSVSAASQSQTDASEHPINRRIVDVLWGMRNQGR
jgi:hypothetical protein